MSRLTMFHTRCGFVDVLRGGSGSKDPRNAYSRLSAVSSARLSVCIDASRADSS